MFDGFVALEGHYRTIHVVAPAGVPVEPPAPPEFRLYGPDGLMAEFIDVPMEDFDEVDDVHSWTSDIDCSAANGFIAGETYRMVIRSVVESNTLIDLRSFTVT